jgi:hypothetical protein
MNEPKLRFRQNAMRRERSMSSFFPESSGLLTKANEAIHILYLRRLIVLSSMFFMFLGKAYAIDGALWRVTINYHPDPGWSISNYVISPNETLRIYPWGFPSFTVRLYSTGEGSNPWTFSVTSPSGTVTQWTTPPGTIAPSRSFGGDEQGVYTAQIDDGPTISWTIVWVFHSYFETNPNGCIFEADGITYTAPRAVQWDSGSTHSIAAITPQECGGRRYSFLSWSDGGALAHTITVPDGDYTYIANFTSAFPYWDIDADHKQDISVWRPDTGVWYILPSNAPGTYNAAQWGVPTDIPIPADYDGDGKTDIAVWRPDTGAWYTLPSNEPGTYSATYWGVSTDIPVPADYDGDGKTDIAVWRPDTGVWYALPSNEPGIYEATQWGVLTDIPVPADYDGDGKTDIAVWRPDSGVWYALPSNEPGIYEATQWGVLTDIPVPADYDGDGKTDIAVWRPDTGVWYTLPSNAPGIYEATQWGVSTDIPVPADYDGDGKTDIAVWRPDSGVWYALPSTEAGSYTTARWGTAGDVPVASTVQIMDAVSR